jgi:hypothetical protein
MDAEQRELHCAHCDRPLEMKEACFTYLGHTFQAKLPTCPVCGRSFVSETLAEGRMRKIESMLETK